MANIDAYLEAERRGILPADKSAVLQEARRRGLVPDDSQAMGDENTSHISPERQKEGLGRTVFDQAMQGATFGFADEIGDMLGSGIASLATGQKYGDTYSEARELSKERLGRQMEDSPAASIASNLAGGLLTGGAAATTKAGSTLGNLLRSGNAASRVAKGAAAGAASGSFYGVGAGNDGERAESARRGAVLGGISGAAAPVITGAISGAVKGAGNIAQGIKARGEDALSDSIQKISDRSNQSYSRMRQLGATFTPQANQKIVGNIEQSLLNDGPLNPNLHNKVLSAIQDIKSKGFSGLEELDQWRQVLGDIAGNFTDKVNARKARVMMQAIDDSIETINPNDISNGSVDAVNALMNGRKEWGKKVKFETVSNIINGAAGDANKLKRDLDRLRLSNKTRGWSTAEKDALKQAATQTTGEGILKVLGKFGFDLGSGRATGNTALPVFGGILGGAGGLAGVGSAATIPAAAAIPAFGTLARSAHKAVAAGKAENLLKVIERGGSVPLKQIMALPPKEAQQALTLMRAMQIPNASVAATANQ